MVADGVRCGLAVDELLAGGTALLDVLFSHTPLGIAVFDRDLVLRRCNRVWAEFVEQHGSLPADRVVPGRTIFEYFPGTETVIRPAVAPVLAGKVRWHQAVPHARRDGTSSYWDLMFAPLRKDGEVVGVVDIALDVTERHLVEMELRRSEARFQSIMANASDVTVVVDAERTVRYASPSVQRLIGVSSEGAVGRDVMTTVHREDVAAVREMIDRAAVPGQREPIRCRLRHLDGSWRTFDAVAVDLLADPDVGGIVLNFRDVTERTEAEAELARRDAILEAVRFAAHRFLESPGSWRDAIGGVLHILGTATGVHRVYIFEHSLGARGALLASQSYEWVADGTVAQIDNPALQGLEYPSVGFQEIARALGGGEVVAGLVADLGPARAVLAAQDILSIALVPVFVDGRWWGFIGFDDCARPRPWSPAELDALRAAASTLSAAIQRQHAEDRLREHQAQYRHVFEATGEGLVISDLDGKQVEANPAFHRMHGYQTGELIGRPASTWVHPDHHRAQREFRRAIDHGAQPTHERIDVRKDGSSFPVQVTGSSFMFRGSPHVLSVVRDDTERSRALELLKSRVKALSSIAASMSVNQALSDTLQVSAESVVAATPAIACSAYVLQPDSGELRVFASVGLPEGYSEAVDRCWRGEPDSPTSRAFLARELVVVRDAVSQGLANQDLGPLHPILRAAEWDTIVVVPMGLRRSLGSVNAYYPRGSEPTDDDLAFLRAVADQAAVAVENSRLLAEAQSRAGLEERQRLARELHDSVSQALYGISLGARTARSLAEHSPDKLAEPLDYVLSLADAGMTEMRSLIFELRPESLAAEGLVAALGKQVAVLRARHRLTVRATLGTEPVLSLPVKEAIYRIGQEALHNVVKHAQARNVAIRLTAADGHVVLEIGDDGVGFDPGLSRPGHLGLLSMRERAAAHRGEVSIESRAGTGTTVRVRLPALADSSARSRRRR